MQLNLIPPDVFSMVSNGQILHQPYTELKLSVFDQHDELVGLCNFQLFLFRKMDYVNSNNSVRNRLW